jgi:hypothetical protein
MSVLHDDRTNNRQRGFSSPGSRDAPEQPASSHFGTRPGAPSELPSAGHGLPAMMQPSDLRGTLAPISHSPEAGAPSIVPGRPDDTRSGRTSISSQFWSRPPSLLAQQSSTGSVTSLSSFAQPRTPSESSLPIHALLSSKPEPPSMASNPMAVPDSHIPSKPPGLNQQYPGRPPGDPVVDGRLPYINGMSRISSRLPPTRLNQPVLGVYPSGMVTHAHPVAPITSPLNQSAPTLPRIAGGGDPGLDGMSALLRASDIVGRPEQ